MAQIGLQKLHIAILEEDTATNLKYAAPERVVDIISANVNPNVHTAEIYADDRLAEVLPVVGKIEVTVETNNLPLDVRAKIFGNTVNDEGVLVEKITDTPPYLALGFKSLKSSGEYRYVWLLKGMAQSVNEEYTTKKDGVDVKTPSTQFIFMSRIYDDELKRTADEGPGSTVDDATWFAKVPGDPAGVIVIKVQPASVTVTEGSISGDLSVSAIAVGATNLGYQWYSNTTEEHAGGTLLTGKDKATFEIPTNLTEGKHYYYCKVTADGAKEVLSDIATITVEGN